MGSIHGLQVSLRIPVAVIENHDVRACKVDTKTSRTSCEQEYKLVTARSVIFINSRDAIIVTRAAINTTIF